MGEQQLYKIFCVNCRKYLFVYRGDFRGALIPNQFCPRPGVPKPASGEPMICPDCHDPWYMLNTRNGAPILMTDKGWKPRAPEGKQPAGVAANLAMHPEEPDEFKGVEPDFLDPAERIKRAREKPNGR